MATILRAYNDNGVKYDLDLFNEEQFLLEISAIESGEIGKVFGVSSQQFSLPPTKNNQEYFGYLDEVGAVPATAFTKRLPCQVLQDGQEVFSGFITLDSVITNKQGDTIYNAVVVNEVIDFKLAIENKTFGDLDWSDYNHDLTYTNVSQSWDNDLFSGDVVYPLVEYGLKGNDITEVVIANGGSFGYFTSQFTPLKLTDFKPAIRASVILNKIFESVGYSYTSSFFESAHADKIYVLSTRDENRGITNLNPVSQSFQAYNSLAQSFNAGDTDALVEFDTEVYDNADNWNTSTFRYTTKSPGNYSFSTTLPASLSGISFNTTPRQVEISMYINGAPTTQVVPAFYNLKGYANNASFILQANFSGVSLNLGDYVDLRITFFSDDGAERFEISGGDLGSIFECYESPTTSIGANVDLGGAFNPDDKVLDFIQGLIEKFNLVIEPQVDARRVFSIETYNDWVDSGIVRDWSNIVDRSVKWEITHPIGRNPREVYFSDIEDKDSFNQYKIENSGRIFGDFTYDSEAELANGIRRVGSYFAPTPMKYIEGDTNVIVPQIFKWDNGIKKRIAFKPRLLYNLGKKTNDTLFQRGFLGSNLISSGSWYLQDENSVVHAQPQYPQFHHVERLPMTDSYRDLNFNAYQHWEFHQPYTNANTIRDAVYEYWSYYLNEIFDVEARLVKLNIVLKPTDIIDFQLSDKIHIDGHYYRINKLQANLTRETSVECELVKVPARKSHFPRRRILVSGSSTNEYTDVVARVAGGGRIEYVDYETDSLITDAYIINEAGNLDGFTTIEGDVSYVPIRTTIPTNNYVRGGANYIDDRVDNATIVGGGNRISANTDGINIYGSENTINEGSKNISLYGNNLTIGDISGSVDSAFVVSFSQSIQIPPSSTNVVALNPTQDVSIYDGNKVVVGNIRNQGAQYETYNVVEASSGFVLYLTGSGVQDRFHHHFTWSGGNGTATIYIEDSTQPQYDGLLQRFTTDATLGASKVINLTPIGGTIDGSAEEPLNKPYDGMTAEVINGQWIVVQRKG